MKLTVGLKYDFGKKIKQNKSDDKGGLMSEDLSQVEKTSEV